MATCMPWYKVHAGWSSHPKVGRLCDVLTNDLADAYVARLWDYCAERQGDGHFPMPGAPGAIERAVRWAGERGALVDAMVAVGLLDREDDGSLTVHDWTEEQRAVAEKFKRDRQKKSAPRGLRADSSESPRDSLSTLYSPISTSQASDVVQAEPSAENEGDARGSRGTRTDSARTALELQPAGPERPAKAAGPDPEPLRALWNRLAPPKGLHAWVGMSKQRAAAARAALAAVPDLGRWEAFLAAKLSDPFHLGQNDRGWRADVDWLLRTKTRDAVADFNPSTHTPPAGVPSKPTKFIEM